MSKVLYIKANAKPKGMSRTFMISDAFMESYAASHPDDEIITLDLYAEGVNFLTAQDISEHFPYPGTDENHPMIKYSKQFFEADKYILAEPLWNLGIPAIMKAYIDYICVNSITFQYTAEGAVGKCVNKRALNITTRGGEYSQGPGAEWETGDSYLRKIFSFLGITDFTTIAVDCLDMDGIDVDALVSDAVSRAQKLAVRF